MPAHPSHSHIIILCLPLSLQRQLGVDATYRQYITRPCRHVGTMAQFQDAQAGQGEQVVDAWSPSW